MIPWETTFQLPGQLDHRTYSNQSHRSPADAGRHSQRARQISDSHTNGATP